MIRKIVGGAALDSWQYFSLFAKWYDEIENFVKDIPQLVSDNIFSSKLVPSYSVWPQNWENGFSMNIS